MYSIVLLAALTATVDAPAHGHGSCHGCCGYSYGGCHGCHGYGYGYGYGCCGGYGYGCCGGYGWGCCGGYYGGTYGSCSGCCGGTYGSPYSMMPIVPGAPAAAAPAPAPAPAPKPGDKPAPAPDGAAAKLQIEVPEDTRIFVDDRAITVAAGQRTFNTPSLDRNTAYYYIVRAETVIDGKPQVETKQVVVRAGQTSEVAFPRLTALKNAAKSKDLTAARD